MSVFGENPTTGQENPVGINQALGEPAQPENVGDGENVMVEDNVGGEGQEEIVENNQNEEKQIEQIDLNDSYEKKVEFVQKKFKSAEDFEQSINELQKMLGRENEEVILNTEQEAIDYYIQLEKEKGEKFRREPQNTSQTVNNPNNEKYMLQQQVNSLQNTVQNLMFQLQQNQQTGQPSQTQTQEENDQQIPDINFDDIDTKQFMKEFYEKGPNAESFKKVIMKAAEQISDQKLAKWQEEQQKEQQTQQQKQQQAQQLKVHYDRQADVLKQKYGDQEFENNKPGMLQVFKQYPMYLNPQLFPNGFEIAYQEAKKRSNGYSQQQNTMQNQQQMANAQKMAARMPKSNPNQRFATDRPSQEEIEKAQIFQTTKKGGIFG